MRKLAGLSVVAAILVAVAPMAWAAGKDHPAKATLLHYTGTATQYITSNGSVSEVGPIDYGHLIEVSDNAVEAHLAHGDVFAKGRNVVEVSGVYVLEIDLFKGSPGQASSVWLSF